MRYVSLRLQTCLVAVGAVLLALAMPLITNSATALAQGSSVALSPTQGPPGAQVTATGSSWTAGDVIQTIWGSDTGPDVGNTATVNSSGGFTLTFGVPSGTAPGSYQVFFYDETERYFVAANENFTVTQPVPLPAAPSSVTNTPLDSLTFYIGWKINSTNQTGFQINNGVTTITVGANQNYYEWPAQPNQYMCIAVRAINSGGSSAWAGMWTCATTPGVQAPPAGKFTLPNYNSGQCLGVLDGANNTWAVQGSCKTPDQTWTVGQEDGTSGYYQLINGSNECLGVNGGSTANGADVVGWQCLGTSSPDQYWAWVKAGVYPTYDYLVNYKSGQVLMVYDNVTSDFAQVVQSANIQPESLNSQLWHTAAPGNFPAKGVGTGTSYCTGYAGGVTTGYQVDNVYACQGSTTGTTTFDAPGSGVAAWQCTEFSARFLWAIYGIWAGPGIVTDGATLVSQVNALYPGIGVGTPGSGSVPAVGDVISLGPGGSVNKPLGHTGVVISANPSTGQFQLISENWNPSTNAAAENTWQVDLSGGHNGEVELAGTTTWTTASWLKTAG